MKTSLDHLSQYAFYHQNRKNIATHFVGIPMIFMAVVILLSRPQFFIFGLGLSPAIIAAVISGVFYIHLDKRVGALMVGLLILSLWFATYVTAQSTIFWLATGIGLFVFGWVFQFIGHYIEGKKPAFVDDIIGLVIGPFFVVVEALFLLGLKKDWQQEIRIYCDQQNNIEK